MQLAPTPKDTVLTEGTAQVYRFRQPGARLAAAMVPESPHVTPAHPRAVPAQSGDRRLPLLIVPSLINRWYILDLREGASVVAELNRRFDLFCLDWGVSNDEDRYLGWDAIVRRLGRAVRFVRRTTGSDRVGLLGYCVGGTLAGIYAALEPSHVAALVNLAGPFDFAKGGLLSKLVDPRWFDPQAIASAGNISGPQMQAGFQALQPLLNVTKWISLLERADDPPAREAFMALETWATDNTPFPAAAYATYIRELYQENRLVNGTHRVLGREVDLGRIACPILTIVASKDSICPPPAATALNALSRSEDQEVLTIPGGHVGAVIGPKAQTELYPKLVSWLEPRLQIAHRPLTPVAVD